VSIFERLIQPNSPLWIKQLPMRLYNLVWIFAISAGGIIGYGILSKIVWGLHGPISRIVGFVAGMSIAVPIILLAQYGGLAAAVQKYGRMGDEEAAERTVTKLVELYRVTRDQSRIRKAEKVLERLRATWKDPSLGGRSEAMIASAMEGRVGPSTGPT